MSEPAAAAKKRIPWIAILIPVALLAAGVLAFALPPTHALLANGPLKPLLARVPGHGSPTAPATPDPAAQPASVNGRLAGAQAAAADKDRMIAALRAQVAALQDAAAATPQPAASASPTAGAVTPAIKRDADVWAQLDADKAAALVAHLPTSYVRSVFAQMPPDAVAEIVDALPAKTAAQLTGDAPTTLGSSR